MSLDSSRNQVIFVKYLPSNEVMMRLVGVYHHIQWLNFEEEGALGEVKE